MFYVCVVFYQHSVSHRIVPMTDDSVYRCVSDIELECKYVPNLKNVGVCTLPHACVVLVRAWVSSVACSPVL